MNKFYLIIVGLAFVALAIIFDALPRPRVSELEKRELATFPEFSLDKLASGKFTAEARHGSATASHFATSSCR